MYLHSASEDKRAEDLAAKLEKARTEHLAAIDQQKDHITAALDRERELLVKRQIALRDLTIATILDADANGKDSKTFLQNRVDRDWSGLTGLAGLPGNLANMLRSGAFEITQREVDQRSALSVRDFAISRFESATGRKGKYCDEDGQGEIDANGDAGITAACQALQIQGTTAAIARTYQGIDTVSPGASALLGNDKVAPGGELGSSIALNSEIAELRKAQKAITKEVNAKVKALDAYYKCQIVLDDPANKVPAQVSGIAKEIQDALAQLAGTAKDPETGAAIDPLSPAQFRTIYAALQKPLPLPAACSKLADSASADKPDTAAPALSVDDILNALKAADKYAVRGAVLAAIQEEALGIQAGRFANILDGLANATSEDQKTREGKIAAATLRIFGNVRLLALAEQGKLPDVSGVLVALADVKMRQEVAQIEADRLDVMARLASQRIAVLRQQGIQLAEAHNVLNTSKKSNFDHAMLYYAASLNDGQIPAVVLSNEIVNSRYLPWIKRERAIVSASYAMLVPVASELQAYGKGGFSADTIARYLQVLGIGAISVTK